MVRRLAVFLTAAGVLLAGCGGSSDAPAKPTHRPSASTVASSSSPTTSVLSSPSTPAMPTVPADVPTTGPNLVVPGDRPPVMPMLATEHSTAGAIAFAKFFELTIDWAYATTSTAYMKHYIQPSCITCLSGVAAIDNAAAKHRHFIGGRMTITSATSQGPGGPSGAELSVLVKYALTSVEVVDAHNRFVDAEPALHLSDQIALRWLAGGWTVTDMAPVK